MLKLNDSETRSLLAQPETGMGYQLVEVTLQDNETPQGIAYKPSCYSSATNRRRS